MQIYKILTADQWAAFEQAGRFDGAPIDLADGFVHTSTAAQAQETLDKNFADQTGLWLAALDTDSFGELLKWEISRGGAKFPHIFRALIIDDVVWCKPINGATLPDMT
jgi:uncharacterized protein (DUF952 family)